MFLISKLLPFLAAASLIHGCASFAVVPAALESMYFEPGAIAKSAYLIARYHPFGEFHYRGVNPAEISSEQMDQPIIVCLHGSGGDAATFVPLIDHIRDNPHTRDAVIYALDKANDYRSICEFFNSLVEPYALQGKELKVIFVGHSAGGTIASLFAYRYHKHPINAEHRLNVSGIIAIASRLSCGSSDVQQSCEGIFAELDRERVKSTIPLYSILAENDYRVPVQVSNVAIPANTFMVPDTNHIGIIYNERALGSVDEILSRYFSAR